MQAARAWWARYARAHRYVLSSGASPSAAVTRLLRQEKLVMEVAGRRVWILVKSAPEDRRAVFLANYWPVAATFLDRYEPAAVTGVAGVRLYLGDFTPPTTLRVHHAASLSEHRVMFEPGFGCLLQPRELDAKMVVTLAGPSESKIPVLAEADLLLTLDEPEVQAGVEPVLAWLRHLVLRTRDLDGALERHPRPVVVQRLADLAEEAGNASLARQLDAASRRISVHAVSPSRTGVGTRIIVPASLNVTSPAAASPWIDLQRMRLARQSEEVAEAFRRTEVPTFSSRVVAAQALSAKAYDAYHSTTMEGYRISADVVEAIVAGEMAAEGGQNARDLEAAMNVQGYSNAFDLVIELAATRAPITRALVLDLHEALYRPSVEAGLVNPRDLRRWRNGPVGLAGFQFVPPNHVKLPDLMAGLEEFAARDDLTSMQRALLVHLEFVTVHPFYDGNGRIGRLLMNLSLLSAGHPWVTVRSDARTPFFRAIEAAQVNDETVPFLHFLRHELRGAVRDLRSEISRSKRLSQARRDSENRQLRAPNGAANVEADRGKSYVAHRDRHSEPTVHRRTTQRRAWEPRRWKPSRSYHRTSPSSLASTARNTPPVPSRPRRA